MATLVLKNATVLVDGLDMSGDCNECTVTYSAEMLDATTFGGNTRKRKGGLTTVNLSLKGFLEFGDGAPDPALFASMGATAIVTVSADSAPSIAGIENAFAFKCARASINYGGPVGTLLPFTATFEGAGTV